MAPSTLPRRYVKYWEHPWWRRSRLSWGFRRWLLGHGFLTPHFAIREAGGQGRHPLGTALPKSMYRRAQVHAFRLERLRHRTGDRPVRILSWYRNPAHNEAVGGVSNSQHLNGIATDFSSNYVASVGRSRFDKICNWIWKLGGFGHYPSGSAHTDSRGYRARW